ncbi:ankyrin repeat domain-containing protein 63 [Microcaecilia unicolor]|uniref:Ankyrin repeat domain-containing protein 63-like n=1 Tax=Microcaecilia unicolor TaxID=1415580 RepID=A0A6P7XIP3_9AMPH|nr:ankyrin repeat domain-containing protein 63-like [Microcaecilia unicolor]
MLSESATEDRSGAQALLDAMTKEQEHLARFILDAADGRIVNARTERAGTPLIAAVQLPAPGARATFLKLLLERGARVNCQDATGRTALSHACERGHLDAVESLVRHGADPELSDTWGNTALLYAAAAGHAPVLRFLVRAFKRLGLQLDRPNRVGNSALEVARHLGHRECMLALSGKGSESSEESGSPAGQEEVPCNGSTPRSLVLRRRFESMDSIEEEGATNRDNTCGPSDSPGSVFSGVPIPRLRRRSWSVQYGSRGRGFLTPLAAPSAGSPLRVLLTPLTSQPAKDAAVLNRFQDAFNQKRSSLPSVPCVLSPPPTPPAKLLPAARKSRSPPAALAILGSKLLRRFTFPEFKKPPEAGPRAMVRSETFPLSTHQPQVDSKPSTDSISSVKCEFDFQLQSST